jgi:hypothetical protein
VGRFAPRAPASPSACARFGLAAWQTVIVERIESGVTPDEREAFARFCALQDALRLASRLQRRAAIP